MKTILKSTAEVFQSFLLFYLISTILPGISTESGFAGLLLAGTVVGLAYLLLPEILRFFKFPRNFWGTILVGTLLIMLLLWGFDRYASHVIAFGAGETEPLSVFGIALADSFYLGSKYLIMFYHGLFFNFCSIILYNFNKGNLNIFK